MLFDLIRHFLFKCEECDMILSVDFEEEEDIDNATNNRIVIECTCGGKSRVLLD